jgi:hypothetical protein
MRSQGDLGFFPSPELGEETQIQHTLALLKNGMENGNALPTP